MARPGILLRCAWIEDEFEQEDEDDSAAIPLPSFSPFPSLHPARLPLLSRPFFNHPQT